MHRTNAESSQIRSEDTLLISKIPSSHLLLEVNDNEEEKSFFDAEKSILKQVLDSRPLQNLVQISAIFVDGQEVRSSWFCCSL